MGNRAKKREKMVRRAARKAERDALISGVNSSDNNPPKRQAMPYKDWNRENASFETYYKAQKIVPEDQWDDFMGSLRAPLPAAFRITSHFGGQSKALRRIVDAPEFKGLASDGGEEASKPALTCIPWYPEKYGWQLSLSRVEIRKSESSLRLHNFLLSESESGYISRQEAVSMLPPLVLDVKPHHRILDMCAAPGSKTSQLIELLHSNKGESGSGVVVANDIDNKRCYMLVHQAKRLHSPSCVITNHDACEMPNFWQTDPETGVKTVLKFDRVLCDAPCSGDGTLRKNIDVWAKWNVANANNFNGLQTRIARRGLEMLKKDGLMVYSTCSLNPQEDEAVVSQLLTESNGGLELMDVSHLLPGLKYTKGLKRWVVMTRDLKVYDSIGDVETQHATQIRKSMFPPEDADQLNLDRCIRILPHQQDTGGFFLAVFKKNHDRLAWEPEPKFNQITADGKKEGSDEIVVKKYEPPKKKLKRYPGLGFKEDPFLFLTDEDCEWHTIKKYYQINDDFPFEQLMYRCEEGKKRNIYFLTKSAQQIMRDNEHWIKFINGGARVFNRNRDHEDCIYRLCQEGLPSLYSYINPGSIVDITFDDVKVLLAKDGVPFEELSDGVRKRIEPLPLGSCILQYKTCVEEEDGVKEEIFVPICGWKGKATLSSYIAKNERIHFQRICGIDTRQLETESREQYLCRQERKAQRVAQHLAASLKTPGDDDSTGGSGTVTNGSAVDNGINGDKTEVTESLT